MKLQPQRNKLEFTPSGNILFHSSDHKVAVWDVVHGELKYSCPGYFIGQSLDSRTFLTYLVEENGVSGWELTTGNEVALVNISADAYPLHQRVVIIGKEFPPELCVEDAFGIFPPKTFSLPHDLGARLENWAIVPDNVHLKTKSFFSVGSILGKTAKYSSDLIVYTLWGDVEGHDWASGTFLDLNTGQKVFKNFTVCRFLDPPPLYFSSSHNLLISGGQNRFDMYDFSTGQSLQTVFVYGGGGSVVSVHPQYKWLVASNAEEPPNAIRLIDTRSSNFEGKVKRVLLQGEPIEYLEFHPDGRRLASLLKSGEIHFWDVQTGQSIIALGILNNKTEETNLTESILEAAAKIRPRIETKNQTLKIQTSTASQVQASKKRLLQVLSELLTNAHKFTLDGGEITLTTEQLGDFVRVSIIDTGIGISAKDQESIFAHRESFRDQNVIADSGLGLAVLKAVVKDFAGEIGFESELGKGSTFWFTVPVA